MGSACQIQIVQGNLPLGDGRAAHSVSVCSPCAMATAGRCAQHKCQLLAAVAVPSGKELCAYHVYETEWADIKAKWRVVNKDALLEHMAPARRVRVCVRKLLALLLSLAASPYTVVHTASGQCD